MSGAARNAPRTPAAARGPGPGRSFGAVADAATLAAEKLRKGDVPVTPAA
jgi:hypothetical protein